MTYRQHPPKKDGIMAKNSARTVGYILLGIALPLVSILIWRSRCQAEGARKKAHVDELQETAVIDSFPASDPPANW